MLSRKQWLKASPILLKYCNQYFDRNLEWPVDFAKAGYKTVTSFRTIMYDCIACIKDGTYSYDNPESHRAVCMMFHPDEPYPLQLRAIGRHLILSRKGIDCALPTEELEVNELVLRPRSPAQLTLIYDLLRQHVATKLVVHYTDQFKKPVDINFKYKGQFMVLTPKDKLSVHAVDPNIKMLERPVVLPEFEPTKDTEETPAWLKKFLS